MKRGFWIPSLFVCFLSVLSAEEEPMMIESMEANYDGNKIILSGDVILEHALGRVEAQEVVVIPPEGEKKWRFGDLEMSKNIKFSFTDGGQLTCGRAYLNYLALTGHFTSDDEQEFVVYTETQKVPLLVKSREMTLHLSKEADSGDSPRNYIKDIIAEHQVTVDYNHDFIAAADYGMYERANPEGTAGKGEGNAMPGFILLRAAETEGVCQVTNSNGDLITATQIGIDTIKRQICFAYPKGALFVLREGRQAERLDFSSDTLVWDEKNQTMTLRDHVSINQKGLGHLTTDHEMTVLQHEVDGKKQLHTIESKGKTVLTYLKGDDDRSHTLTCYGKMVVDHSKLEITMQSPRKEDGSTPHGQQVFFEDNQGEIYADAAVAKYALGPSGIVLHKVVLEGHVRLLNSYAATEASTSPLIQYALADVVEYYPLEREMIFIANKGNRILFYDKSKDLQVSAPGLKIKRDADTKKDSFRGIGDVRFSFIEKEFEQLRQRFSLGSVQK